MVLHNLHRSVPTNEIEAELETLGHKVSNVLNIRHRVTKEHLPLYFVDLEPQDNKSICDLQSLCNMKIPGEAPQKKNHIVQCTRCQSYGHTKATASNHMFTLSVWANTIHPCVQKTQLHKPFVLYVAEDIRRA